VVLYLPRAAVSPRQLFLGWSLLLWVILRSNSSKILVISISSLPS
jgi:hypothetical protein